MLLHEELSHVASVKVIGFVHDGIEAIAYIRGTDQFKDRELFPYPDLILLDFKMPRCNGMQVLDYLRRQFHRPKVILWSNTLEQVSVPQALRFGADLVCRKPSTREELIEIINRFETNVFNKTASASTEATEPARQIVQL